MATREELNGLMNRLFPVLRDAITQYPHIYRQYDAVFRPDDGFSPSDGAALARQEISLQFVVAPGTEAEDFRRSVGMLMDSFVQENEIAAMALIEGKEADPLVGLSPSEGGDGHPLVCVQHHNLAAGAIPLSVEGLSLAKRHVIDDLKARPLRLLVPPELEAAAIRLLPEQPEGGVGFIEEYRVLDFADVPFEVSTKVADDEQSLVVTGYERVTWICADPRSIWGSVPKEEEPTA